MQERGKTGDNKCFWSCVPLCCLLFAFFIIGSRVAISDTDDSVKSRFLSEAPKQWLEYRKMISRHTKGIYKWTIYDIISKKKQITNLQGSFILDLEQRRVRSIVDEERGPKISKHDLGKLFNEKYGFGVQQGSNGKWFLNYLEQAPPNIPDDLIGRDQIHPMIMGENTVLGLLISQSCLGQKIFGAWLPLMAASPCFEVIRATYLDKNKELVKVEFKFEPEVKTGGAAPGRSGIVILDAKRYWLIREANMQASYYEGPGTLKITNTFNDDNLSIPFVSKQIMWVSCPKPNMGDPFKHQWIKKVDLQDAGEVDEKIFTLAAFDISEPEYAQPSRARLWLFCITIILLVICIAFFTYRRWQST